MGLDQDIAAFEARREELEQHHAGKWAVFQEGNLVDTFDTFENAARVAVARFGRGPYLIRQVGSSEPALPASVLYRPVSYAAR